MRDKELRSGLACNYRLADALTSGVPCKCEIVCPFKECGPVDRVPDVDEDAGEEGSGDDSGDDEAAAAAEREREREEAEVQRLASTVWCDLCKDGGVRVPIGDVIVLDKPQGHFSSPQRERVQGA